MTFNGFGVTGAPTLRNNDVLGNDSGDYGPSGSDSVSGTNGNISIDPQLTSPNR